MLNIILAFLKKEFRCEASYKLPFLLNLFAIAVTIFIYYFIGKLFGPRAASHLKEFGTGYFPYVLLSMAFFNYIGVGIGSFSSRIRSEQLQGTLESLLITPARIETILCGMAVWNLIFATFNVLIYILLGIFLFKIDFSHINILSAGLTLFLTLTSFSCLGIISASFTLVFKKGNPIAFFINTLEGLLGGVYFPIGVMPVFLQFLAKFLPVTYAIRAMELSVYRGYSPSALKEELIFLFLFSAVLIPVSLKIFKFSLAKACRQGNLIKF